MKKTAWYSHPEAHVLTGAAVGLKAVDRFSELSLAAARTIEWHSHSETEVICCLKGMLHYVFRSHPDITVTAGCFLVVPRDTEHQLVGGVDQPCRRISIYLKHDYRNRGDRSAFTPAEFHDLHGDVLKKRLCAKAFTAITASELARLADLVARPQLTPREIVEVRILADSVIFAFATSRQPVLARPQIRLVEESLKWLRQHYAEHVTIDQLVAYMGYGKSRFFTLFKELTGVSPIEWLLRYRVERACELLRQGRPSVGDVARRVGFNDATFFARIFRRYMGQSPGKWGRN